ncbi:hypothetical protein Tco_0928792 [Tanacetum coccineum]
MLLNLDQLEKQLDKEEFQEIGSMDAFRDVSLVVTESSGAESGEQDTSSRSGNDTTHVVDTNIRPINDQEPFAEVDSNTAPDSTNMCNRGGEIDQNAKNVKLQTVENADLKAQIQENVFANATLKNELRKLKRNSVDTKFSKPSILGKLVIKPLRNQSVVRQPNAFQSERPKFSKPRFASQVEVKNDLPKPVTPHYFPKVQKSVLAKSHHVIAPGSSRNSQEESYGSNDMAHHSFIEEARKKTQERNRNSKTSVMPSAKLQNTANSSKPKPRDNNQTTRNWPTSKSRLVQNLSSSTPNVPPSKRDCDILFQPLFDEYFNPTLCVVSPMLPAAAPLHADIIGTPSSTM